MKFKAFSSLIAASTIFVSVLPATAQYYPKSSIHGSSNSTSVHRSGSSSSRTTSTYKGNSSRVKVSLPGIANINRGSDRSSGSSTTRRISNETTRTIHGGGHRALPYPGIGHNSNFGNSWNTGSFGRHTNWSR